MVGKIVITRTGYDPQLGKHVKDPYLGPRPTLGACRPDVREQLKVGDHFFVISGKVPGADQYVLGGFEIAEKIDATEAYQRFPDLRLRKREDGQLTGNIIVGADGRQHPLDDHTPKSFPRRVRNYVVGRDPVSLTTAAEIAEGRKHTLTVLRDILGRKGDSPFDLLGRSGAFLTDEQVRALRSWLTALKASCVRVEPAAAASVPARPARTRLVG
ncbi:MAG: hypothetical protein K2X87_17935 [Gemmataceae bacterium]|nr:hypothetical protein [Gemmataceae bacterium]